VCSPYPALHEAQPHVGRVFVGTSNEIRTEALHEAFAGSERERSDQQFEVELVDRAQNRISLIARLRA
jgi:hypothetical protein